MFPNLQFQIWNIEFSNFLNCWIWKWTSWTIKFFVLFILAVKNIISSYSNINCELDHGYRDRPGCLLSLLVQSQGSSEIKINVRISKYKILSNSLWERGNLILKIKIYWIIRRSKLRATSSVLRSLFLYCKIKIP